jgi:hypothetical protein
MKASSDLVQTSDELRGLNIKGTMESSHRTSSVAPPWLQNLEENDEEDEVVSI